MKNIYTESSRYYERETVTIITKSGKKVSALKLRILPLIRGEKVIVKDAERLDIISQNQYRDPTKFWHIADANTALYSKELIERKNKKLPIIEVPKD